MAVASTVRLSFRTMNVVLIVRLKATVEMAYSYVLATSYGPIWSAVGIP